MEEKNKTTAGLLAIFLGAFGAHFFYMGNSKKGTTRLLLSIFVPLCAFIFGIMGIVDGIKLLSMSDKAFAAELEANREEGEEDVTPAATEDEDAGENTKEPSGTLPAAKQTSNAPVDYREKFELLHIYKDLLDFGAITEREFQAIKIRIMGWNV